MIRLHSRPTSLTSVVASEGRHVLDREVARYDVVPSGSDSLRALVEEAAHLAEVPVAAINLLRSSSQRTLAAVGAEITVLDAKDTMCHAIITEGRRVHVRDVSQDDRWAHNPFVDGRWGDIRFYGAHPLVSPSGVAVGTLCVLDSRPRDLDAALVEALDDLAVRVVEELERQRLLALQDGMRRLVRSWGRATAS